MAAKLFEYFDTDKVREGPVYKIYRAAEGYYGCRDERPWLQMVCDVSNRKCYPISAEPSMCTDKNRYFHLPSDDPDFAWTQLARDSWVDAGEPSTLSRKKGTVFKFCGVLRGELAKKFDAWLKSRPRAPFPNPPLSELLRDQEIFIAPWVYIEFGFDAVTPFEVAALNAYATAAKAAGIPDGTCFYDGVKNVIVLDRRGVPGMLWWIRAYMDFVWVNFLDNATKREWCALVSKKRNALATRNLFVAYADSASDYRSSEELTYDSGMRAMLAEAAARTFADQYGVGNREITEFVEANCWAFFFKKSAGARR